MGAWLTPDAPAPVRKAYRVVLPASDEMRSIFWGAFLLMCKAENYEKFGTMEPEEVAAEFEACWRETYITGAGMVEVP